MTFKQELAMMAEMNRRLRGPVPGYAYTSLYEYVSQNGREMESRTLSEEQLKYVRSITRCGSFPIKQCFANSQEQLLRADSERLEYFEGYATTGILPVLHGWLVLDGNTLIDLTWRRRDASGDNLKGRVTRTRIIGEIPEGYGYIGLSVASRKEIKEQAMRTKFWSSFLDDWQNDYPCLRAQPSAETSHALLPG